jgi:hypothetical protein
MNVFLSSVSQDLLRGEGARDSATSAIEKGRTLARPYLDDAFFQVDRVEIQVQFVPGYFAAERPKKPIRRSVAGLALSPHCIRLFLDPDRPHCQTPAGLREVTSATVHELHHARFLVGHEPPRTLGFYLMSEGGAQAFQVMLGFDVPPNALALDASALAAFAGRARRKLDDCLCRDDYIDWFQGREGDSAFPVWGGYSLGYAIVRAGLAARRVRTAAALSKAFPTGLIEAFRRNELGPPAQLFDLAVRCDTQRVRARGDSFCLLHD